MPINDDYTCEECGKVTEFSKEQGSGIDFPEKIKCKACGSMNTRRKFGSRGFSIPDHMKAIKN